MTGPDETNTAAEARYTGRHRIHFFTTLASTMDRARQMAVNGCPHMTVVTAAAQTKGRGRLDRTWVSDAGGLYFTMVLRPQLPPQACWQLNFQASVSLARLLQRQYGLEARVKWPNDVLVEEKKIAGMLSETAVMGQEMHYVNIGIGINVNNTPPAARIPAVALKDLIGRTEAPERLLEAYLDTLTPTLRETDPVAVLERWRAHTNTLGRRLTVETTNGTVSGIAEDVAPDGALILRLSDGSRKTILYGDCFYTPAQRQ